MASGAELVQAEVTSVFTPTEQETSDPVYRVCAKVTEKVSSEVSKEGTYVAVYGKAEATIMILDQRQAQQTGKGWTPGEPEEEVGGSRTNWGSSCRSNPKVCAHAGCHRRLEPLTMERMCELCKISLSKLSLIHI